MTWLEEAIKTNAEKYRQIIAGALDEEKEAPAMKVSYNGFVGNLIKLKCTYLSDNQNIKSTYDLVIFDREKACEYRFKGINFEDMKFLGGAVSFGG